MEDLYIPDGFLIGRVIADLMNRVTALEQHREPIRDAVLRIDEGEPVQPVLLAVGNTRRPVLRQDQIVMEQMYRDGKNNKQISESLGFSPQTIANQFRKLGILSPQQKRKLR